MRSLAVLIWVTMFTCICHAREFSDYKDFRYLDNGDVEYSLFVKDYVTASNSFTGKVIFRYGLGSQYDYSWSQDGIVKKEGFFPKTVTGLVGKIDGEDITDIALYDKNGKPIFNEKNKAIWRMMAAMKNSRDTDVDKVVVKQSYNHEYVNKALSNVYFVKGKKINYFISSKTPVFRSVTVDPISSIYSRSLIMQVFDGSLDSKIHNYKIFKYKDKYHCVNIDDISLPEAIKELSNPAWEMVNATNELIEYANMAEKLLNIDISHR